MSDSLKHDVINAVGRDKYIRHIKSIAHMYDEADIGICSNVEYDKQLIQHNNTIKKFSCEVWFDSYNQLWIAKINGKIHCGFSKLNKTKRYVMKQMFRT